MAALDSDGRRETSRSVAVQVASVRVSVQDALRSLQSLRHVDRSASYVAGGTILSAGKPAEVFAASPDYIAATLELVGETSAETTSLARESWRRGFALPDSLVALARTATRERWAAEDLLAAILLRAAARIADKRDEAAPRRRRCLHGTVHLREQGRRSVDRTADLSRRVKPIDTGGSKGVRKASNAESLRVAVGEAFAVTREPVVVVESFLEGYEIGADCFVQDGEPHVLLLRRKYVMSGRDGEVLATYASVCPAMVPPRIEEGIRATVADIARAFDLRTTPSLVQFIVSGDGARVIEFAPRLGGGLNHQQVLLRSGVDLVAAAIDAGSAVRRGLSSSAPAAFPRVRTSMQAQVTSAKSVTSKR